jgi:hypothetical protein
MTAASITRIIGASVPRAGHHYLVRLLRDVLGPELHYCEFYSPPECCRAVPCQQAGAATVVYQKNHDFDLTLPADLAGVLYLVQTREPLAEAISDHELWRAIDPVLAADPRHLPLWLGAKAAYFERFLAKWVQTRLHSRLLVRYEDLQRDPLAVLHGVLGALGRALPEQALASSVDRQRHSRGGGLAHVPRPDAPPLPSALFDDYARLLAGTAPVDRLLTLAAAAHGAVLDRQPEAALQQWQQARDEFPANPHVAGALWEQLKRCGREPEAHELALALARQPDVAPGVSLSIANALAIQGAPDLALAMVDRLLVRDNGHPPYHLLRAHFLAALQRPADAARAAACFVQLASVCDLQLQLSPEQRVLRAQFRGTTQHANWDSAARLLAGQEHPVEHEMALGVAACCTQGR